MKRSSKRCARILPSRASPEPLSACALFQPAERPQADGDEVDAELAFELAAVARELALHVGDGDDADGWLATAKIAPQTAVSTGLVKRSTEATAEAYAGGKLYAAADTIDITVGVADVDAGEIDVFIVFIDNVSPL